MQVLLKNQHKMQALYKPSLNARPIRNYANKILQNHTFLKMQVKYWSFAV